MAVIEYTCTIGEQLRDQNARSVVHPFPDRASVPGSDPKAGL